MYPLSDVSYHLEGDYKAEIDVNMVRNRILML